MAKTKSSTKPENVILFPVDRIQPLRVVSLRTAAENARTIGRALQQEARRDKKQLFQDAKKALAMTPASDIVSVQQVLAMAQSARMDPDHVCMYTEMAERRGGMQMCLLCLRSTKLSPKKVKS